MLCWKEPLLKRCFATSVVRRSLLLEPAICLPSHYHDLKAATLFTWTCSVLLCAPVYSVNTRWRQFVCGQHRLTSHSMLILLRAPRGVGSELTKCCDVVTVLLKVKSRCSRLKVFDRLPPVYPYAICGPVYVPPKERIMLERECNWFVQCIIQYSLGFMD